MIRQHFCTRAQLAGGSRAAFGHISGEPHPSTRQNAASVRLREEGGKRGLRHLAEFYWQSCKEAT